ncbi:hypothetical protein J7T55_010956 [Diaporthe amygdali]|uniref:uncharacterized protein n=1 Tax=Phomopsis amygdali TaxID=1214568 RepID=UPI0022FDC787|nr:uncharacterized protein J7T55_010956 [Diaporthe amygdali]KAJ0103939.1 hypothetical protein J7T55_010956 [Diaporthe amygdali]
MKLTNTLLIPLIIAFETQAQNHSTLSGNHSIDMLNFTEADTLARSLTWYHLDDGQETCGNTDAKTEGKDDILKEDCQQLVDFLKSRPGYWKVNGYNKMGMVADLGNRGTCEFTVAREDGLNTYFE